MSVDGCCLNSTNAGLSGVTTSAGLLFAVLDLQPAVPVVVDAQIDSCVLMLRFKQMLPKKLVVVVHCRKLCASTAGFLTMSTIGCNSTSGLYLSLCSELLLFLLLYLAVHMLVTCSLHVPAARVG